MKRAACAASAALALSTASAFSATLSRPTPTDSAGPPNRRQPQQPSPPSSPPALRDRTNVGTLEVPSCGVGTIAWQEESEALSKVVRQGCNSGFSFFDTAERYGGGLSTALGLGWGECERNLAQYIQASEGGSGPKPVVATKFTPSPWRRDAASVVEACRQSAARLGTERIDLYQLHMPDIVQPLRVFGLDFSKDEAYWDGLAECYNQGLVSNVGVSNYGPTMVARAQEALARRGVPLASNQIHFSLLSGKQSGAQRTVDVCTDLGVRTLAYFPLGMGLLTGKYSTSWSGGDNKRTPLEFRDLLNYAKGGANGVPAHGIEPLVRVLQEVAETRGKTVAQISLNWIISKGAIPIPGARTTSQLKENSGCLGWRLTDDEVALLEGVADGLGFAFNGAGFKRSDAKFVGYGVERWSLD